MTDLRAKSPPKSERPKLSRQPHVKKGPRASVQDVLGEQLAEAVQRATLLQAAYDGPDKKGLQQLNENLVALGHVVVHVEEALHTLSGLEGSAHRRGLSQLALTLETLTTLLEKTPHQDALNGLCEQLAGLSHQDGMMGRSPKATEGAKTKAEVMPSAPKPAPKLLPTPPASPGRPVASPVPYESQKSLRPPLPTPPSSGPSTPLFTSPDAPPLPPKIRMGLSRGPASWPGLAVQAQTSASVAGLSMHRARSDGLDDVYRGLIADPNESLVQVSDGLRLSRANATPEQQRLNRLNYIRSLASSSVYGGELEAKVMADMLGVGLNISQPHQSRPLMSIAPWGRERPTVHLLYQPNQQNPRLSHYDAWIPLRDGGGEHLIVPADGHCMFYSVAVSLDLEHAKTILKATTVTELRDLRTRFLLSAQGHPQADALSDGAFKHLLLENIARNLRQRVAQHLRTGRYDEALDLAVITALEA